MNTVVAKRNYYGPRKAAVFAWHREQKQSVGSIPVCKFWLAGKCTKNPCRFLHSVVGAPNGIAAPKLPQLKSRAQGVSYNLQKRKTLVAHTTEVYKQPQKKINVLPSNASEELKLREEDYVHTSSTPEDNVNASNNVHACNTSDVIDGKRNESTQQKICQYWIKGNCIHGDQCKYLHSWSYGEGLTLLAQLEGHEKAVTGVTLPAGSDKLFSSSKDGTIRVWDCYTGKCVQVIEVGAPVECLISKGSCVFAGIENGVKAWNIKNNNEITINAPGVQVHALYVVGDRLLAGVSDGSIVVWTYNRATHSFDETTALKGHVGAVISLYFGGNTLYSGSMDNTIRTWDWNSMQCTHTLDKHSDVIMSMVCWGPYLMSCSLDRSLKIWAATEAGGLEETFSHNEEHGILALCGMSESSQSTLLCSCNDNSTRLYELPTFREKGRIFSTEEVRKIEIGPGGLIFAGDASGRVCVWKYSQDDGLPEGSNINKEIQH